MVVAEEELGLELEVEDFFDFLMRRKRGRFLASAGPFLLVAVIILVWPLFSDTSHLFVSEMTWLSLAVKTLFLEKLDL